MTTTQVQPQQKQRATPSASGLDERQLLAGLRALKNGDFSARLPADLEGVAGEICETFNELAESAASLKTEVGDLRQAVGREGRTRKRIAPGRFRSGWQDCVGSVNELLDDLHTRDQEVEEVISAVARGDLSQSIDIEAADEPMRGDFLRRARSVNDMVTVLSTLGSEVTRVAQEVGVEGKLGAQVKLRGARGAWKELCDSVNLMSSNVTAQVRDVARVTTAVARGDLAQTINVEAQGEIHELKRTINTMIHQLGSFADEVTRVAREVGTEGILGGQAQVRGVSGVWRELTENVNSMANNLTFQVRNIADVASAIASGDLSKKITVEVKGEILELKDTINTMVDQLGSFADEVTRMAREVGTEGVLGGQAVVRDVSGIWKELTENVNSMASNLTNQVRNIAEVASAVAGGDLSRKITVDARGEVLDLKDTINNMVDQLNAFGAEVSRVAREVGVEGKLGGQASVDGVRGTWKELTDNVNLMASNLTNQVRDIAEVTTSVAKGDLTRKIAVDAKGEILELKNTINTMVDQLSSFAEQVTRLASDVGVEGKLGGQADVRGVSGTWRDLTDAVNSMANNLTVQVRNISQVAAAIAQGDLQKKIVVDAKGEILELKNTINTMVDQLSSFAEQVTRVAREVGTEGKLGGQASVDGVRGIWKDLTDNVNQMASNLTNQVRDIAEVSTAIASGDLGPKITVEVRGEMLDLKNTINTMVDQLSSFADEVTRVARDVGVEGELGGQARVRGVSGIWKELTDNVNLMASNLTNQVRDIANVTTAVAKGDLSRKITVEVRGEILELKNTINTMVDQLSSFADEVTRVAREVGTEGALGGQAEVRGVSGTWRELTDNVNVMARNLTEQVRGIATVVTAVANGDLKRKLSLEARGEIFTLVETINNMIVTLSTFADQVTGVARDVGVEGKLGGQADVPGAAGIWRDLTNNVNELAGNLTRQVRAIGDVATAVTKGDLTQSITVEARGEVALLKDNLNKMIRTLAETTRVNQEQDWLKTNLTRFTRMLQGQRDLFTVATQVLSELAPVVNAKHGAFFMAEKDEEVSLKLLASYAFREREEIGEFSLGEGLVGQAAVEKQRILVTDAPRDYIQIGSALGEAPPRNIVVVPILFEGEVKGVIELASFHPFTGIQLAFLEQLLESLGIVVATIEATMRTDELLRQSQGLTQELRSQQEELRQTNEALEEKASQLTEQKAEVERKNREVEIAKEELEEKAEQLALTSRYKSQFLANMSHEIRTPLNGLLVLSRHLSDNGEGNLSDKQVEYARTIFQSGTDLLTLINEILDLAKIESGTMAIELSEIQFEDLEDYVDRSFRQVASEKALQFSVELASDLPPSIVTDAMRLRQVLRNLLANAFKFTEKGAVALRIFRAAAPTWTQAKTDLTQADMVIGFAVEDSGVGIPPDKQRIIFEAFQQADGGTSREYGGTGLGLSISREIAGLLGGEIHVTSAPGVGSTFVLYLPRNYAIRGEESPDSRGAPRPLKADAGGRRNVELLPLPSGDALSPSASAVDDRSELRAGDRVLLIIEREERNARFLLDAARESGFRGIVALEGGRGFELARSLTPDAICLDLCLPDMDGWVLLDQLKRDRKTRHVPVQVVTGGGGEVRALARGARAFLEKPADRESVRQLMLDVHLFLERQASELLLVAGREDRQEEIQKIVGGADVRTTLASEPGEALGLLEERTFDCLVVDGALEENAGELLDGLEAHPRLWRVPVVLYADAAGAKKAMPSRWRERLPVTEARTSEQLLEKTAVHLHREEQDLAEEKQALLRALWKRDPLLARRTVLVVDDDLRNIYAIAAILETHAIQVVTAENGHEALARLDAFDDDIDIVLMDIMMPAMDGYEATRRIRAQKRYSQLPVIALTAKAMQGDREKCLEAGACDYITKPVDPDRLISLLRVWLQSCPAP